MPFRQLTVSGFPAIALSNDEIEVVCLPALGGKLSNLRRHRGREWLWRNPALPLRMPEWGTSYVETADSGGWDECFPTIGPCPMPGAGPDEPPLPDHGELWALPWEHSVSEQAAGAVLMGRVEGRSLPYDLTREVIVPPTGSMLRIDYRLRHRGTAPFPYIWAAHPLLNVQAGSTITLPTVARVTVLAVHGRTDLKVGDIITWPLEGAGAAWTFPGEAGWAVMLAADLGPSGRIEVTDPARGERLEISTSAAPQVGLWINAGGWAPQRIDGRSPIAPYVNLGVEPSIGVADRLDRAVGVWHAAAMLDPGTERRWSLTVRLPDPALD
ncbi:MAG: hypothetical protein ACHQXA_06620 [Gemmatimonadales bacterium]